MRDFRAYACELPDGIALRAASSADQPFLSDLYASTREEEMKLATAWTDAQKRAFLQDQFALQDQHYRRHYPNAERLVIERGGRPVGRLLIDVTAFEVRLMDVALLPAARGQGIGTALLDRLLAFADGLDRDVTLHVEPFNPALRMYEREGFAQVEMRGIYWFMRRPKRGVS
jgi:GNAT superfamily N-acetyltransferase